MSNHTGIDRQGLAAALTSFLIWGLAPLYFYAVRSVPPFELVSHRVVWSVVFILILMTILPQRKNNLHNNPHAFTRVWSIFRQPRLAGLLILTALLISCNWLVFIWAISVGHLLEASLGYFITPLLVILLGRFFLGETLRPLQICAIVIATIGVAWRIWQLGTLPWVALFIGSSFAFYSLLRKKTPIDAMSGLLIETLITLPVAIGYLLWTAVQGTSSWGNQIFVTALLPLGGVITATPLMLFAFSAQRLPLSTLGFLQYLSPSMAFLLAILVFREPFDSTQLIGFILIWIALAVYSVDMIRTTHR